MSILGDAKERLKSSGITYPGWESKQDIYGNRVAPGGITNYRLPSFVQQLPRVSLRQQNVLLRVARGILY